MVPIACRRPGFPCISVRVGCVFVLFLFFALCGASVCVGGGGGVEAVATD